MSRWTHIAGLVRIDSLSPDWQRQVELRMAGPPTGSEGPVQFRAIRDHSQSSGITAGYVAIWGDLRDFGYAGDVARLIEWLDRAFAYHKGQSWVVRNGVVEIEDEGDENSRVWQYKHEEDGP